MEQIIPELPKIINAIVSIFWFLFVVLLVIIFYKPIRYELLPKLSGFKAMGVELSFIKDSINAAIKFGEKNEKWQVKVSKKDKDNALKRAEQHLELFKGAQILWVDDFPEYNLNERRMFRQLGTEIDTAKSTNEALEILKTGKYDLIISDMARGDEPMEGKKFLDQFYKFNKTTPVIFYVGDLKPELGVPGFAFGITKRPDELLHLVLDAIERNKF